MAKAGEWAECDWCGVRYQRARSWQRHCSAGCRNKENCFDYAERQGRGGGNWRGASWWEEELRAARLQRIAEVLAHDDSLSWDGIAERWGIPQAQWEAWRQALRRMGVRPPPAGNGLAAL